MRHDVNVAMFKTSMCLIEPSRVTNIRYLPRCIDGQYPCARCQLPLGALAASSGLYII
ncbi:hypothetical protein DPMN_075767 [Dreissena polymorpha]|uniref:Uncharacterized protein n=1 Tax=Dreissena polymorpha TaxID=45954 RepID=A0A9D4BMT6_DREPO|nr:hypothetical protein DPMN_075767 [Dreissena polymorpha]